MPPESLRDPITGQSYVLLFAFFFLGGMLIYGAFEYFIMPEVKKWRAERAIECANKWAEYRKFRKHLLQALDERGDKRSSLLTLSRNDYLLMALPSAICEPFYEQKNVDNKGILTFKEKLDFWMKENYGREK